MVDSNMYYTVSITSGKRNGLSCEIVDSPRQAVINAVNEFRSKNKPKYDLDTDKELLVGETMIIKITRVKNTGKEEKSSKSIVISFGNIPNSDNTVKVGIEK